MAGIALGVAVASGMGVAVESARRAFALSNEAVMGRATHVVEGGPEGLPESLYPELRRRGLGIRAAPMLSDYVTAVAEPPRVLQLIGIDPVADRYFRAFAGGGAALMVRPDAAVMSEAMARSLGLAPGDRFPVDAGGRVRELTLVAVLPAPDAFARASLAGLVVTDIATAQEVLGVAGRIGRLDLIVEGDPERVRAALPAGVRLAPAGARGRATAEMTRAFEFNLRMLSLLAFVIAGLLVYNAVTFLVLQRRRAIDRDPARARGDPSGGVLRGAHGGGLPRSDRRSGGGGPWRGPCRRAHAARAPHRQRSLLRGRGRRRLRRGGTACTGRGARHARERRGCGAGRPRGGGDSAPVHDAPLVRRGAGRGARAAWERSRGRRAPPGPGWSSGSGTSAMPVSSRPSARSASPRPSRCGSAPRAPHAGFRGSFALPPGRWRDGRAGPGSRWPPLAIAMGALVGVSIMVESFRQEVTGWLESTLQADFYLSRPVPGRDGTGAHRIIDSALADRLAATPGVAAASRRFRTRLRSQYGEVRVVVIASDHDPRYRLRTGSADEVWRRFRTEDALVVSEPFASRYPRAAAEGLVVRDARGGARRFAVAGVYQDFASEHGIVPHVGRDLRPPLGGAAAGARARAPPRARGGPPLGWPPVWPRPRGARVSGFAPPASCATPPSRCSTGRSG